MTLSEKYIKCYEDYFWTWEEEGTVLAIPGDSTIAYRTYVMEVLDVLANTALPPFGAVLLTIIATNNGAKADLEKLEQLLEPEYKNVIFEEMLDKTFHFLAMIQQLPAKYKQGSARIQLLSLLFEETHNGVRKKRAQNLIDAIRGYNQERDIPKGNAIESGAFVKDFRAISLLANKYSGVDDIIARLAAVPGLADILPEEESVVPQYGDGSLLDQLKETNQGFYVAVLVQQLISGLNIPFVNHLHSESPQGGNADITNKGELERLLLSEHAYDDLVFISRIANSEALYTHRETPPRQDDPERILLIDVSIRNWGTPKLLAYAVAMAITHHPKTKIVCSAFAVGNSYHPLKLDSVDDVIDSLQVLDNSLHAANGIEQFLLKESRDDAELFLLTSSESLRQPELARVLSENYKSFKYWIYTSATGTVDIFKRQQNSRRHVQTLQLPLETLWEKQKPPQQQVTAAKEDVSNVPLLYPAGINPKRLLKLDNGNQLMISRDWAVFISADINLYHKGWEMIVETIPAFDEAVTGTNGKEETLLLLFKKSLRRIYVLNCSTRQIIESSFNDWRYSEYESPIFINGRFCFLVSGHQPGCWYIEYTEEKLLLHFTGGLAPGIIKQYTDFITGYKSNLAAYVSTGNLLKNVNAVYINKNGNLVLNKHEFYLNAHGSIKLDLTSQLKHILSAKKEDTNHFVFPDGSIVQLLSGGILLIKSSVEKIMPLYVPLVLERSLGIAAGGCFTGNAYYIPEVTNDKKLSPDIFWKQYVKPILKHIEQNAT